MRHRRNPNRYKSLWFIPTRDKTFFWLSTAGLRGLSGGEEIAIETVGIALAVLHGCHESFTVSGVPRFRGDGQSLIGHGISVKPFQPSPGNRRASRAVGRAVAIMKETSAGTEEISIGVPWGVIVVKCWNSAKGRPVLAVHGLGENAGAFDGLIPLLSPDHYFVAVDLPGHGRSSHFPRGITPDFMLYVSQLLRVVKHFRWRKLSLMGHSFGAHLLEFFAATYASEVEKLILIDAISPTPVPSEVFLLFHKNLADEVTQLEEGCREPIRYAYEEALEQVANRRMSKVKPESAKRLLERCLKPCGPKYVFTTDPRARAEIKPAIGEEVLFDQIKQIRCPVLVILADDSELFRPLDCPSFYTAVLDILSRSHPASTVVRVPGNHCVHSDRPEDIAPIVDGFLSLGKKCKI